MITLFSTFSGFGLPEVSPYVTKTDVQLKLAGVAYVKDAEDFAKAPKGKVPYIHDEGQIIPDSTFIRAHLEQKYGVDLDAGLDARQRAEAWAIERMLEDHLAWASAHARWLIPENFAKGPAHFVDQAPEALRPKLREELQARVANTLHGQGMGRHSPEEITELGARSLAALSQLLGDRPFLMGAKPTAVDATAFAVLAGILTPFFDSALRRKAETFDNLVAYTARMMKRFYPDHPWQQPSRNRAAEPASAQA